MSVGRFHGNELWTEDSGIKQLDSGDKGVFISSLHIETLLFLFCEVTQF